MSELRGGSMGREGGGVGGSRVARKFSFRVFAKFSSNLVKIS